MNRSDRFSGMKESKKIEMDIWEFVIILCISLYFLKTSLKLFKVLWQKKSFLKENFNEQNCKSLDKHGYYFTQSLFLCLWILRFCSTILAKIY